MYLYVVKCRITNVANCFDKKVVVVANNSDEAREKASVACIQEYGYVSKVRVLAFKQYDITQPYIIK